MSPGPTKDMNDGSPMSTRITEQLTQAGRTIEQASFAIIDREAGPHGYSVDQWPLVRRLIHASADFEFNGLTRFHPAAVQAGIAAVRAGRPIVADVEMIRVGVSRPRLAHFGGEAVSGDLGRATWAVLGLGLLTGLPLLWVAMRQKPEKGNP